MLVSAHSCWPQSSVRTNLALALFKESYVNPLPEDFLMGELDHKATQAMLHATFPNFQ
jgi:hypothetical protein